jgi:hypothetical protein
VARNNDHDDQRPEERGKDHHHNDVNEKQSPSNIVAMRDSGVNGHRMIHLQHDAARSTSSSTTTSTRTAPGMHQEMVASWWNNNEDAVDAKVCPDCYSRIVDRKTTCGTKINQYSKQPPSSEEEARLAVAREYPDQCGVCDPANCAPDQTIFRRPDRMAPPIQAATTHYLTSIGDENRVPTNINRTEYFSKPENVHPNRRYLFEYNPSIIVLPDDQRIDVAGETAYYLASYRVSSLQQCITGDEEYLMLGHFESNQRPRQVDYLGLALLRNDLSILQDVVLEPRLVVARSRLEDFRLFVFPPHQQIVVTSFDFIFPIWLQNNTLFAPNLDQGEMVEIPQYAPSAMHVYTRTAAAACTPFIKPGTGSNKNINYFVDETNGNVIAEYKPMNSKYRMPVVSNSSQPLLAPCVRGNNSEPEIKSPLPMRSFDTVDILHFWNQSLFEPYSSERGSACCVRIDHPHHPTGPQLLLGLSHSKTPYPRKGRISKSGNVPSNMFFTSLYAMEAVYPFTVVARSGRFCFGHATVAETTMVHNSGNPFARSNLTPLRIDREYDCPRIHFVSGLSEVVDDPTRVIIGYGINDCVPRFVQVDKADLVRLLFFSSSSSSTTTATTNSSSYT